MANEQAVIVGCGMMTAVGLSAPETAASARARVQRLTEIEWRDQRFQPFTVAFVPDEGLPDLTEELGGAPLQYRESRMLRLAAAAITEATACLPKGAAPAGVPLVLGMPEHQTTLALQPRPFLTRLAQLVPGRIDLAASEGIATGRAAGLMAVEAAVKLLAAGKPFVLAGGVDSFVDLYILGTLQLHRRVRTDENSDGFTPGEGAGFVVLTKPETAARFGMQPMARVVGFAAGREAGHVYAEEPYRGDGLAETFAKLFADPGGAACPPVQCVYASLNGERYWGKELGVAVLRNKAKFGDYETEHPAECFGDAGAAHGAVMLGLAALGMRDKYRGSPALVYASSDYGDRAAVLVSAN